MVSEGKGRKLNARKQERTTSTGTPEFKGSVVFKHLKATQHHWGTEMRWVGHLVVATKPRECREFTTPAFRGFLRRGFLIRGLLQRTL